MIGKILGNRYEIVDKIGGGGMALVYKAKCNLLNRYVAVKILRSEFTNDRVIIDKFKGESQAAASLSHPNIVNIYDVGEEEEIYYIIMEYVKGRTLKEVIKEKETLTLQEITNYTKQIASAIQHAHLNHVIHRDIKPHNILITEDNRAKVTDFGIALAATSSTITNMGSVIGSVHYFSPEQARGGYTDEKSDLYSLGIVMYEMATGKVPFEGDSPITVALKHIQEEPLAPSNINPTIDNDLEQIILKLIQKDQASRYQDTQILLEDLKQINNESATNYLTVPMNNEDSPTQIIPRIKDDDISKSLNPKPKKTSNSKNKLLVVSAIFAALIGALLFSFGLFYFGNLNIFKTETINVPKFVGMDIAKAREEAQKIGLELVEESTGSSEVPTDEIIRQRPEEGMAVKQGSLVNVWVSAGTAPVIVPNLLFKEAMDAPFILENEGLKAGTPSYEFDELPTGTIIQQDPKAGSPASRGSIVNYVVSQGPKIVNFPMPELRGMTLQNAQDELERFELESKISEEYSDNFPQGQVFFQSVEPQTEVNKNTIIELIVSKGPDPIGKQEEPTIDNQIENPQDNDSTNTSSNNITSQRVQIEFKGHSGTVDIMIKNAATDQEVIAMKHDINKDGNIAYVTLTGSGKQEFELFVNGKKQSNISVSFNN